MHVYFLVQCGRHIFELMLNLIMICDPLLHLSAHAWWNLPSIMNCCVSCTQVNLAVRIRPVKVNVNEASYVGHAVCRLVSKCQECAACRWPWVGQGYGKETHSLGLSHFLHVHCKTNYLKNVSWHSLCACLNECCIKSHKLDEVSAYNYLEGNPPIATATSDMSCHSLYKSRLFLFHDPCPCSLKQT